jgi:hypothetical protein
MIFRITDIDDRKVLQTAFLGLPKESITNLLVDAPSKGGG